MRFLMSGEAALINFAGDYILVQVTLFWLPDPPLIKVTVLILARSSNAKVISINPSTSRKLLLPARLEIYFCEGEALVLPIAI